MKLKFSSILVVSAFIILNACTSQEKYIANWSFEDNLQTGTKEVVANQFTAVQSMKTNAEFVPSIIGKGLRTDGYSTSIDYSLSNVTSTISLEGWFALETFPTDTAAFFSFQQDSLNYISACINQFGKPIISICKQGKLNWFSAEKLVEKFKWLNVVLSVSKTDATLFINGKKTALATFSEPNSFSSILIGRDSREKKIHIFPITYINGIIDEIKVWNKTLTENDLNNKEIQELAQNTPDLAVPPIRFKDDFNRPKYHILPAANWTNETHGLIYYKNKYHIFNQKNGTNVYLGRINWGHYSSPDLIQWTEHKPVLTPEEGYDQYGIWSGHAVIDDSGKPAIFYTGGDGKEFGMCLAYPDDDNLLYWKKFENNPLVKGPPKHFTRIDFRDPYVWKEKDFWYMIVGFGIVENKVEKGTVILYKSKDLQNWEYLHPLFTGNRPVDDTGIFWEMPVFWKMNGKYILLVNPTPHYGKPAIAVYWTGDFINEKFVPDHKIPKRLEVINRMLSPSVSLDENGKTTAIAIIPDLIPAEMQMQQGWTHLYSIPRTWDLIDGYIHQQPHPALQKLRTNETNLSVQIVEPKKNLLISKGKHQVEIIAKVIPENCEKFGFVIGKNKDNEEETKIFFDLQLDEMRVDLTKSSKNKWIDKIVEKGKYKIYKNKEYKLHLFIDGSVVEGFINGKDGFTTRLFPDFESSNEIELFVEGGSLKLLEMKVWEINSSNNQTDF